MNKYILAKMMITISAPQVFCLLPAGGVDLKTASPVLEPLNLTH